MVVGEKFRVTVAVPVRDARFVLVVLVEVPLDRDAEDDAGLRDVPMCVVVRDPLDVVRPVRLDGTGIVTQVERRTGHQ